LLGFSDMRGLIQNDPVFPQGFQRVAMLRTQKLLPPAPDLSHKRPGFRIFVKEVLEFTNEFKAKIERGEQDIREGRVRIRKPNSKKGEIFLIAVGDRREICAR